MSEQLGEDTACNQQYRFRQKVHLGTLKIKQIEGHTLPAKQHQESHLAVKMVESKPIVINVVSIEWLVDKFVVGQIVAMETKINARLLLAHSWSASGDPPKADTRAGVVKIPSPHKTQFSSCTRPLELNSQQHLSVKNLAFSAHGGPGLCLRRTDILDTL